MPRDTAVSEFTYDQIPSAEISRPSMLFLFYKRTVDIVTSLILLPIVAVICILALILNPFLNRGRLFYSQKRVGKNNKIFRIHKLRTMQCSGKHQDPKFATDETSRITPLGKFMRDIHVDELPQIINVLVGDMSLIGPRPEQPEFFKKYAESIHGFTKRQTVRPGISGLAQIRWGYTDCPVGARNKLRWDLEYIQRQGFGLEGEIYLKTYAYVFPRIGKRLLSLVKAPKRG